MRIKSVSLAAILILVTEPRHFCAAPAPMMEDRLVRNHHADVAHLFNLQSVWRVGRRALWPFAAGAVGWRRLTACSHRMSPGRTWIGVAVIWIAVLVAATTASASAVTVRVVGHLSRSYEVIYVADPGERNELRVSFAGDASMVTLTDPGAVVRAHGSCSQIDAHAAACRPPNTESSIGGPYPTLEYTRAELGDLDDTVRTDGVRDRFRFHLRAYGGPGDDRLFGGRASDLLDGGGGRDELRAGGGFDLLTDGDRDGADGALAPGPDILDGGPGGGARVSYEQRTEPVSVDLSDTGPDGARGEGDVLIGVDSVTGGRGDDRLVGNERGNGLDGGPGRNLLIGRGGADGLQRATGAFVSCGAGDDQLDAWAASTYIPRTCEELYLPYDPDPWENEALLLAPYPERRHGRLEFRIACPDEDGIPIACSAAVRIRARSDHRLLARGVLPFAPRYARVLALRLTALGRRRLALARHVKATVHLSGRRDPAAAWTIRF